MAGPADGMKNQNVIAAPDRAFAAVTRKSARTRDWDTSFATFQILYWDAARGKLAPRTYVGFTGVVHVRQYLGHMMECAIQDNKDHPDHPASAFLLTFEAFCVDLPAGASAADHARVQAMIASHSLGEHPRAREQLSAWCVDITGRGWSATRLRDDPAVITEAAWKAGTVPADPELTGLITVAYSTGMVKYGLPGPPSPYPGHRLCSGALRWLAALADNSQAKVPQGGFSGRPVVFAGVG
jgi:hypothetical protein